MEQMHRLRSSLDIEGTLRRGRKNEGALFRLLVCANRYGCLRLAFIASRAADKRAVVRNRLRRRAREWVRARPGILQMSVDAVLIFKREASSAPREVFYKELERAFGAVAR